MLAQIEIGNNPKIKEYLEQIVKEGVFEIKNGKAVLSFDGNGILMEIDMQFKKWRRKKFSTKKRYSELLT